MLHCVGYVSSAAAGFDTSALTAVITESREANARKSVTGMLCYHEGNFLQFLEGDRPVVQALFLAIAKDRRHTGVLEIYNQPVGERLFPDWTMGLARADQLSPEQQDLYRNLTQFRLAPDRASDQRRTVEVFLDTFRRSVR